MDDINYAISDSRKKLWECELKTKEKRASKLGKLKDDILTNAKNAAKA